MSDHQIIIRPLGRTFSVTVEPPHPDYPPEIFGDLRSARGAAGGLRMCTGWPKVDLAEEGR